MSEHVQKYFITTGIYGRLRLPNTPAKQQPLSIDTVRFSSAHIGGLAPDKQLAYFSINPITAIVQQPVLQSKTRQLDTRPKTFDSLPQVQVVPIAQVHITQPESNQVSSQALQLEPLQQSEHSIFAEQIEHAAKIKFWRLSQSKPQLSILGMACLVFLIGSFIFLQTLHTNYAVTAQVSALAKKSDTTDSQVVSVPSTTIPSTAAVAAYTVAPSLPKYLKIPSIGVDARVSQVGLLDSGAIGTPNNVFDTAWYTGSALPGQQGATLIDGHVSSWTTHGVFYAIHTLKAGDTMQIVKGDNSVVNYRVVRSQTYGANEVDMQAALTPITPGVSGLNIITCTGQVIKGTSEFNERVVVFAQEV